MRILALAIAIAFFAPSATATTQDAGPVDAEVDFQPVSHCALDVEGEFCAASWDQGQDSGNLTDDNVTVRQFVTRAGVLLSDPSLGLSREVVVNTSDFSVDQPLFHLANQTWISLNDSLPAEAKRYVTLESRTYNQPGPNPPRGLFIVVHYPTPVPDPYGGSDEWRSMDVISWDSREYVEGPIYWDYDSVRPLPSGLASEQSTDTEWELQQQNWDVVTQVFACDGSMSPDPTDSCRTAQAFGALLGQGVYAWESATPNVGVGTSLDEVTANLTPSSYGFDPEPTQGYALYYGDGGSLVPPPPPSEMPPPGPSLLQPASKPASGPDHGAPPLGPGSTYLAAGQSMHLPPSSSSWRPFVVAGAAAGGAIFLCLAFALYHRITKKQTFDNENRLRVYEAIRADPGIRAGTLQKKLDLNYETVLWHLRVLEEFHMIEGVGNGQRRFFLNGGSYSPREKQEILAASSPTAKAIFEHLRKQGKTALSELAESLGVSVSTASETVTRMERAGLVIKSRTEGRLHVGLRSFEDGAKGQPS